MKRLATTLFLIVAIGLSSLASMDDFSSKTILIGMIVSDLDQSMHFYKDVIGMVQVDQASFDVDADFGKRSGLTDNLPIHVEILKLGSGSEATQLKLLHFGNRPVKQENEFIHSHTGIQYLTIHVTNLAPIIERIQKNNIPFLGETPIPLGENHFVLIKDPDGTFVELIGPMEILPPSQYEIMKEKSNFDKYKKEIPYRTPSRVQEKDKDSSSKKFNFFGLFGSKKDKSASKAEVTTSQEEPVEPISDPESKEIRDRFKKHNRTTPYVTPSRKDKDRFIP